MTPIEALAALERLDRLSAGERAALIAYDENKTDANHRHWRKASEWLERAGRNTDFAGIIEVVKGLVGERDDLKLASVQIPNERLLELAKRHPAPHERPEEDLFTVQPPGAARE